MASVTISIEIDAPPETVWAELERLEDHVEWMADAESMTFTTDQTRGVGTVAEVATVIGPLRTTDVMRFVEWEDGRSMSVRHEGLVSGTGTFVLDAIGGDRTRVTRTPGREAHPAWSPDGTRLAFVLLDGSGGSESVTTVRKKPS